MSGTSESQVPAASTAADDDGATAVRSPRPGPATWRGSLLLAELGRLRHRRLVQALLLLGVLALLAGMAVTFATHSTDLSGARAEARQMAAQVASDNRRYEQECLANPDIPQSDKDNGACAFGEVSEENFYQDPRFRADPGLPTVALGVGIGGALVATLLSATGVGADWSSRGIITLLTWEPRRLRFLGTRLLAIALYVALAGLLAHAVALGLGALTVQLRGSWERSTPADPQSGPVLGMLSPDRFWPQLVSLQVRTVAVMVLVALMAAALASVFRSTGGVLGVAFGWFAVVEVVVHATLGDRGIVRFMMLDNLAAALTPGGTDLYLGQQLTEKGMVQRVVHLSNGDGLLFLTAVAAALCVLAAVMLRRRDL
jgi:hypothetical protein